MTSQSLHLPGLPRGGRRADLGPEKPVPTARGLPACPLLLAEKEVSWEATPPRAEPPPWGPTNSLGDAGPYFTSRGLSVLPGHGCQS